MSRCGSTLVTQMLAALPATVAISEAAPIDAMVQLGNSPGLAAMLAAFGRRRTGAERHHVVKLDSWHALALPQLVQAAFSVQPVRSVPWVFLYREPVEVLVSQMRRRGSQTVPELVPPGLYGIENAEGMGGEEYCARVLARIAAAAVGHYGSGGGLLVNYRELPDAVWTKILPHFGIACSDGERDIMRGAARQDVKSPAYAFAGDSEAKQREASDLIRTLAERHLGDVYRQLEALRAVQ
jgi:hypothetical protein